MVGLHLSIWLYSWREWDRWQVNKCNAFLAASEIYHREKQYWITKSTHLEPQDQNDNINFESLKRTGAFTSTAASKVKSTGIGELSVGVITPAFSRALWSKTSNLKSIVSNLHQNQTSQAKQKVHKEPWEK